MADRSHAAEVIADRYLTSPSRLAARPFGPVDALDTHSRAGRPGADRVRLRRVAGIGAGRRGRPLVRDRRHRRVRRARLRPSRRPLVPRPAAQPGHAGRALALDAPTQCGGCRRPGAVLRTSAGGGGGGWLRRRTRRSWPISPSGPAPRRSSSSPCSPHPVRRLHHPPGGRPAGAGRALHGGRRRTRPAARTERLAAGRRRRSPSQPGRVPGCAGAGRSRPTVRITPTHGRSAWTGSSTRPMSDPPAGRGWPGRGGRRDRWRWPSP